MSVTYLVMQLVQASIHAQLLSSALTTSGVFMCSLVHLLTWFYARQNRFYIEDRHGTIF